MNRQLFDLLTTAIAAQTMNAYFNTQKTEIDNQLTKHTHNLKYKP